MASYNLSIVTPNGKMYEDRVESLVAPGSEGLFGVLAHHAPMVAATVPGVFKLKDQSGERYYAVGAGMLEVNQGNVVFLADHAERSATAEEAGNQAKKLESDRKG